MPKIDVTKTDPVWPGKYGEDGTRQEVPRVSLPFRIIETVNESRATREAKKGGVHRHRCSTFTRVARAIGGVCKTTRQAPFTRVGGLIRRSGGCTGPGP